MNLWPKYRSYWCVQYSSPIIRHMTTFLSELRRRNVLRVAAAYGLVTWIVIEAGSVLLPTFGASEGAFQIYVIVALSGFVLALIFAWIFEVTPDGVKLDRNVDRNEITGTGKRGTNFAIIGLLVIALTISITFNITGIRDSGVSPTTEVSRSSIAVLPFESRSENPENALFADGIHDDLLTKLANNKSLKVISRTSVMEYRNTTKHIRQIGEELGVDTILEGAVQRIGNTVRINMQLIDARTDEHLWARNYDRNLTMHDVFEIQSDISASVSRELSATLTPEVEGRIDRIPTDNLVAFSLYTTARSNMAIRELTSALAARAQFEQAIELDPDFAEAHAGLATAVLLLYINDQAVDRDEAFEIANRELGIALELNSGLADAYATLGLLKFQIWQQTRVGRENSEAVVAFNKALDLNPNHASAYMWFASLRQAEGLTVEAIELFEKSKEIDPLGRIPYANLPTLYAALGQNDEALRQLIRATEIHPDWPTPFQFISVHLNALGRVDEALAWLTRARELSSNPFEGGNLDVGIYVTFGDIDRAKEVVQGIPAGRPLADFSPAFTDLLDGDRASALQKLLDVVAQKPSQPQFIYTIISNVALLAGDLDTAKEYALLFNPILVSDAELVVDRYTVRSVVQLAYIAQQEGDMQTARDMLLKSLHFVQGRPRLGIGGFGILDVQIFALLGRVEDAISAFRDAVDEGFRSTIASDFWLTRDDPYLASISGDERFVALLNDIELDIQRMHDNVITVEASGDWESLRQIANQAGNPDIVTGHLLRSNDSNIKN